MTLHECPKCGKPMEHQEAEPDVGVTGGWFCTACDGAAPDDDDDTDDRFLGL